MWPGIRAHAPRGSVPHLWCTAGGAGRRAGDRSRGSTGGCCRECGVWRAVPPGCKGRLCSDVGSMCSNQQCHRVQPSGGKGFERVACHSVPNAQCSSQQHIADCGNSRPGTRLQQSRRSRRVLLPPAGSQPLPLPPCRPLGLPPPLSANCFQSGAKDGCYRSLIEVCMKGRVPRRSGAAEAWL